MIERKTPERPWGKLDNITVKRLGVEQRPGCETHFVPGPDGRRLAVEVSGPTNGFPVLFCHGIPGFRGVGPEVPGIFGISYDRPGYSFSSVNFGRRPVDSARDSRSILNYFGIKEFGVVGRSGGAADTLAIAANVEGCQKAAILVPMGPIQLMGDIWYKDMGAFNTKIFKEAFEDAKQARYYEYPVHPIDLRDFHFSSPLANTVRNLIELEKITRTKVESYLSRGHLTSDNVRDESFGIMNKVVFAHYAALKFGSIGRLHDILGMRFWGFDPKYVKVPTKIWAATADEFTPYHHAEFLADRIGNSALLELNHNATHIDAIEATADAYRWCARG